MKSLSWHDFRQKAARQPQRIVFAEGDDVRVVQAALTLQSEKIAVPWLVGSKPKIEMLWKHHGGDLKTLTCVDPQTLSANEKQTWGEMWLSLPKNKQNSNEDAQQKILDPLLLSCLILKKGQVDGFIGGATRTTADTLRAVFNTIGLAHGASTLFGFFLLEKAGAGTEPPSLVLLADCAVIPDPSAKQLAHIAIGAAAAYEFFFAEKPRIAMLSFSTLGSATHPFVDKVREALRMVKEKAPQLMVEGEWQADTALDAFTAEIKGAGASPMAGKANVLIVPDLACGNIAYKLAQRLGHVRAVGPVLWGMAQPANDLSRGCSVEDVIDLTALTALQAQAAKTQPVLANKEK